MTSRERLELWAKRAAMEMTAQHKLSIQRGHDGVCRATAFLYGPSTMTIDGDWGTSIEEACANLITALTEIGVVVA